MTTPKTRHHGRIFTERTGVDHGVCRIVVPSRTAYSDVNSKSTPFDCRQPALFVSQRVSPVAPIAISGGNTTAPPRSIAFGMK